MIKGTKEALNYLYTSAKTQEDFYVLGAKSALYFEKEWTRLKALVNSDQQLSASELCELSVLQNFFFNETAFVPATGNAERDQTNLEAFKSGRLDLLNEFIAVKAQS